MTAEVLILAAVILASIPMMMTAWNYPLFRRPRPLDDGVEKPAVSILIPARDEAANIESAVNAALDSESVEVEVVVLDDHSTDSTADLVLAMGENDPRVRLESAPELPPGWCGKQHACARLAEHATHDLMLFVDADVRMDPGAASGLVGFLEKSRSDLVSAFPRQITGTFLEKLLIPLIEYLLLGYLPLQFARWFGAPGFAAGCGQVFLARKAAYEKSGGHAAIRGSLHDGIKLPRSFREAGFRTDICDGNALFDCRMYDSAGAVWSGLMKNAIEGIAAPSLIFTFTILLVGAGILPLVLAVVCAAGGIENAAAAGIALALVFGWLPRIMNAIRFRQSWLGALLHPLAIALFLVIQWQAYFRHLAGRRPEWRGRVVE